MTTRTRSSSAGSQVYVTAYPFMGTVAELKAAFQEAVDDYLETCARIGKDPDKPYSGNLMLRVDPSVHSKVAQAAELAGKSLNQWGEEVLRQAAEKAVA